MWSFDALPGAGMANREPRDEFDYSVATLRPTPRHRRLAFAVVVVMLAAYAALVPFATIPLPRIDSFIPTIAAIAFVTELVTAVLLFAQFPPTGSRALLVLASGYLFSILMAIPFALTFPGAYAPAGLLGAGPQTAAWLSASSRFGLAVATVGYALLISGKRTKGSIEPSPRPAICWSVAIVVIVVCALTLAVTAGHDFMPRVLDGNNILPLGTDLNGMNALTNVLALLLLWTRRKSVLDLWLMVAVSALLMETAIVALFVQGRFDVGFYGTRVIPLVVSKVVLIALLAETARLHASLSIANRNLQRGRENKLANAEVVVAAIAHEIRQPLTGISSQAAAGQRFLMRAEPDVDKAKKLFEQIEGATFRANEVLESFRGLLGGDKQEHETVDINALTLETIQLLRKELDERNIITLTKLAADLPVVPGRTGQIREVLLNLIQNSIEAMSVPTNRSRVISIVTERRDSDSIAISLQDTGTGIESKKLPSIFDPFVTTKAKGMGLGLAICKMIVDQHGGNLSAASDGNVGARFEIRLPTKIAERTVPAAPREDHLSVDAGKGA